MAKNDKSPLPQDIQEAGNKVFLAGLGALSVAEQEGKKYFEKLVKKGKKYDGPGKEQVELIRREVNGQLGRLEDQFGKVRKDADRQAEKARQVLDEQVQKVRGGVDSVVEGLEDRIEQAVTVALRGLGIPTRDEIQELRRSVQQLSKNLDRLQHERTIEQEAEPEIYARATANGWYDIYVRGRIVDKVHGEEAATEVVARLQQEDATLTTAERAERVEAVRVGGGWYQIKVDGLVVDKVQGKEAAEAAVAELAEQEPA